MNYHANHPKAVWLCPACEIVNFTSSYFDSSASSLDLSNPFESLSSLGDSFINESRPTPNDQPQPLTSSPIRKVPPVVLKKKDNNWEVKKVPCVILKKDNNNWTIVNKSGRSNPPSAQTSSGPSQPNVTTHHKASKTSDSKINGRPKQKPTQRCKKLTIASINFQSIKKKGANFAAFITENSPDIILGNESWLKDDFNTAEIFPDYYQVTRNDRTTKGGGGVFIAINDSIPRIERPDLITDGSEQAWCQLIIGSENIFIGSYYRPQTAKDDLDLLHASLSKIKEEVKSPYIILAGDFNIPNMTWTDDITEAHGSLQENILTIADDFNMDQLVTFPTRRDTNGTENTLDLRASLQDHHYVSKVYPCAPIADHTVVMVIIW